LTKTQFSPGMKLDSARWVMSGGLLLVALTIVVLVIDARNERHYLMKQKFQELSEKIFPKGVDLVYICTNPSSTKYFRELQHRQQNEASTLKELLENITLFHQNYDYFRFFVRSYSEYLQWTRRVYIVVPDAEGAPSFIRNGTHFYIVPHRQFIPSQYLPTFNTRVVEWHLHRLPQITEEFIVVSQNTFFLYHLLPTHFKEPSLGLYKVPLRRYDHRNAKNENPHQWLSTKHTLGLLGLSEGLSIDLQAPLLFNRSVILDLETMFRIPVEETKKHRFPCINDAQLPILYIHFLLLQEHKYRAKINVESAILRLDSNDDGVLSDDELWKHTNLRWSDVIRILGTNHSISGSVPVRTILNSNSTLREVIVASLLPLPYRHRLYQLSAIEIGATNQFSQPIIKLNERDLEMGDVDAMRHYLRRLLKAKEALVGSPLFLDSSQSSSLRPLLYLSPAVFSAQNAALRRLVEEFFFSYYSTPSQFEHDVRELYFWSLIVAIYMIGLFVGCCYAISYFMGVTAKPHNINKNV